LYLDTQCGIINVIPPYILLNPNLYPTYTIETKGFDPLISKNYTSYVLGYILTLEQPSVIPLIQTPQTVGNQFAIVSCFSHYHFQNKFVTSLQIRHNRYEIKYLDWA
jgi:hypothetical protein